MAKTSNWLPANRIGRLTMGKNWMKTRFIVHTAGIVCAVLLLGACASAGTFSNKYKTWDESVGDAESSVIYFWGFNPTSYNGISWIAYETPKMGVVGAYIKIPAGESSFAGDVQTAMYMHDLALNLSAQDVEFTYTFAPGTYYHAFVEAVVLTKQSSLPHIFGRPVIDKKKLDISVNLLIYDDPKPYMGYPFPPKKAVPVASIPLQVTPLD